MNIFPTAFKLQESKGKGKGKAQETLNNNEGISWDVRGVPDQDLRNKVRKEIKN